MIAQSTNQDVADEDLSSAACARTGAANSSLGKALTSRPHRLIQSGVTTSGTKATKSEAERMPGIAEKPERYTEPGTGGGNSDCIRACPVVPRTTIRGSTVSSSNVGFSPVNRLGRETQTYRSQRITEVNSDSASRFDETARSSWPEARS